MAGIVGAYGYGAYSAYNPYITKGFGATGAQASGAFSVKPEDTMTDGQLRAAKRSGQIECETCANRKYQDGSDETDVSFKSPGHISPQASAAAVSAPERQHVANAYEQQAKGGQVIQASVTRHTSVCPECGRSYVSGGETNTMIKYNKDNYSQNAKSMDRANGAVGGNVDYAV